MSKPRGVVFILCEDASGNTSQAKCTYQLLDQNPKEAGEQLLLMVNSCRKNNTILRRVRRGS